MKKEKFKISGMACPACAKGIEKVIGQVKGVSKASVSFDKGELILDYDERRLPESTLGNLVAGVVHDVVEETRKISANFPLYGLSCPECAARIEENLARLEGVVNSSVSLSKWRAAVTYDPKRIDFSQIKGAIGDTHCSNSRRPLLIEGSFACECCETPSAG